MASTTDSFHLQPHHHIHDPFHIPSPPPDADSPPDNNALFSAMGPHFHPDINDELASLMSTDRSAHSHSPAATYAEDTNGYRPHTHNIFDISAPTSAAHHAGHHHVGSASSTSSSFPSHFSLASTSSNGGPGSNGSGSPGLGDAPPYHFNSTLPAINSSMRYDPHPPYIPSPSSFRSPSPHHSRSRSRSRPPSSHLAPTPAGGPTRTARTRRTGSFSSNSPPPRPVPQAIVIPGSNGNRGYPQGWFGPEYPHATPESLPSLTSLPSLPSLGSLNSIHSHSQHIGSPHTLNSPHSIGSPHPFHHGPHGHNSYSSTNGYGSPVESKFGGMALNGNVGVGSMGSTGSAIHGGMPASQMSNANGAPPPPQQNGNGTPTEASTTKQSPSDKAAALANEKRRRRRESHNAVERRRRDNINEKISELATLIPECMLEEGTANKKEGDEDSKEGVKEGASPTSGGQTVVKANKGMILRKSVEYIRYLQQLVTAQGARNRELEEQLKGYRGSASGSEASPPPSLGDANELINGAGLHAMSSMWGLASMPEGDGDEGGEEGHGHLHTLDAMDMPGVDMGMDVDDAASQAALAEKQRGRKATRAAAGPIKAKTSPRKTTTKKVALSDGDDGSEYSDGGMDV
ncbi:BHLH domain-containing protein [Mycena chlorophos]|uniref:BHLH domain-containing protein n=1 Tax=Mycena chlorophos TaxID=658473 RepID=A0A8H6TKF5_MYCCL|nr:BHLH domain-containing protein [Mycena chlorophos]